MSSFAEKFASRLQVPPDRLAAGGAGKSVSVPVLNLTTGPSPDSSPATQLLRGEPFTVYGEAPNGMSFGQSNRDGYVGFVLSSGLGERIDPQYRITALRSHVYSEADIKSRTLSEVHFLSEMGEGTPGGSFIALKSGGYVPLQHVAPLTGDFVDHARRFLGVPYLWGGKTASGLDCSALVQLSLMAAGINAPRDSDMQAAYFSGDDIPANEARLGDLVFWKGHVGIISGPDRLLHANAHHMAVVEEPFSVAAARIAEGEYGAITRMARLSSFK